MITSNCEGKAIVRFSDVPKLTPAELQNPTGLVVNFNHNELVEMEPGQFPRQIDQKLLDELADLLIDVYTDAEIGVSNSWDGADPDFQRQVDKIEGCFSQLFGLDIKQHPVYALLTN